MPLGIFGRTNEKGGRCQPNAWRSTMTIVRLPDQTNTASKLLSAQAFVCGAAKQQRHPFT